MEAQRTEPHRHHHGDRDDSVLVSSGGGLLGDEQVVRGIAAALVLGLSGAHLRTWLSRLKAESVDL